jgi:hypothetical protein
MTSEELEAFAQTNPMKRLAAAGRCRKCCCVPLLSGLRLYHRADDQRLQR